MPQTDANVFLQALRGNQAVIVLAYLTIRRGMTIEELETCTSLDNDTVRANVKKLASKGWLFMQRGERGRQTWLPAGDTFFGRLMGQNPRISDSGSSSSLSFYTPPLEQEQEELTAESENFGFCLKTCDEVGIREPKRKRISRLDHVTPAFIRAHVEQAKAEGLGIGTAIFRIENNWPVDGGGFGVEEDGSIDRDVMIIEITGRKAGRLIIPGDMVRAVAEFTGHKKQCPCIDCVVGRRMGISQLCPVCKHRYCECDESEDE